MQGSAYEGTLDVLGALFMRWFVTIAACPIIKEYKIPYELCDSMKYMTSIGIAFPVGSNGITVESKASTYKGLGVDLKLEDTSAMCVNKGHWKYFQLHMLEPRAANPACPCQRNMISAPAGDALWQSGR